MEGGGAEVRVIGGGVCGVGVDSEVLGLGGVESGGVWQLLIGEGVELGEE